ncbi:hypothetical protein HDU83_001453 [Entophlyctis luteolus]|nr:hypothetical protein HDU83_001453 [Entophlyctis luteolus]
MPMAQCVGDDWGPMTRSELTLDAGTYSEADTDANVDVDAGADTTFGVSKASIGGLVHRLVAACRRAESARAFDASPTCRLANHLLLAIDVKGVPEAFVRQLTLCVEDESPAYDATGFRPATPPTFILTSDAFSLSLATSDCYRASVLSPTEREHCMKTGQILVCSYPKENNPIEKHLDIFIQSLMRVFEPSARGIRNDVFMILRHMLLHSDSSVEFIIEGVCAATRIPYLQLIWRSAMHGDQTAMAVLERIITKPWLKLVAQTHMVEATLTVFNFKELNSIFLYTAEFFSKLVEAACSVDGFEEIFCNFLPEVAKPESLSIQADIRNEVLADSTQYQACIQVIHTIVVRSAGRCPVLPTGMGDNRRPILQHMKNSCIHLVAKHAVCLWGAESVLFVESDLYTGLKPMVAKSATRVLMLEIAVESMFNSLMEIKKQKDKTLKSLNEFFESFPWQTLLNLSWTEYKEASIFHSLVYKLFYMVLGCGHAPTISFLSSMRVSASPKADGSSGEQIFLFEKILELSHGICTTFLVELLRKLTFIPPPELHGYFSLMLLAVEHHTRIHANSQLAHQVHVCSGWAKGVSEALSSFSNVDKREGLAKEDPDGTRQYVFPIRKEDMVLSVCFEDE